VVPIFFSGITPATACIPVPKKKAQPKWVKNTEIQREVSSEMLCSVAQQNFTSIRLYGITSQKAVGLHSHHYV
jgi:hypothetical protein